MTKPILVTSAAGGTQGRTDRHVSEMLLERGARVRALSCVRATNAPIA